MNLIYSGSYKKRFAPIKEYLMQNKIKSVLELCFGDIFIAKFCKEKNISWLGFDINENFIEYAKGHGYNATFQDLSKIESLPKSDICIMVGSLYHFNDQLDNLFKKIFESSSNFLISEPIKNLSSQKGIIGYIAKRSANTGKGHEDFRYDQKKLELMLHKYSTLFNFDYETIGFVKKDMIVILKKR